MVSKNRPRNTGPRKFPAAKAPAQPIEPRWDRCLHEYRRDRHQAIPKDCTLANTGSPQDSRDLAQTCWLKLLSMSNAAIFATEEFGPGWHRDRIASIRIRRQLGQLTAPPDQLLQIAGDHVTQFQPLSKWRHYEEYMRYTVQLISNQCLSRVYRDGHTTSLLLPLTLRKRRYSGHNGTSR
jgi:hypothetical protein